MISTKLQENGKPIRLEVVIDKPAGDGPFPLLVVNHGSTGRGNNPARSAPTASTVPHAPDHSSASLELTLRANNCRDGPQQVARD